MAVADPRPTDLRADQLWSHLHWLGVLGALGSFTAAAQRLGVSKAAMSQRITDRARSSESVCARSGVARSSVCPSIARRRMYVVPRSSPATSSSGRALSCLRPSSLV